MKSVQPNRYAKPPSNIVYHIDGTSCGLDEGLVDAIRTAVRAKMERQALEIPRLPSVAGRIMKLAQDPDVQIGAVTEAVAGDPVLAARVLRLASAAANGGAVANLDTAILRLGLRKLRDLVFAESMDAKVFPARGYRSLLEPSWRLSIAAAIACEALAKASGIERESAFLMGLLHDIGKPTLVHLLLEYERKNDGKPIGEELAELVLSQLHEEIGAYVLEQWTMPAAMVEAARSHHRYPPSETATPVQRLIHAANLVCEHLGIAGERQPVGFNVERVFLDLGKPVVDSLGTILETVSRDAEALLSGFGTPAGSGAGASR